MVKNYIKMLLISLLAFSCSAIAEESNLNKTVADVKTELINDIREDGYLSDKMAEEVSLKYIKIEDTKKYITTDNTQEVSEEIKEKTTWTSYLSFINLIKVAAIVLLLIAFSGVIKHTLVYCAFFIYSIPAYAYQSIALLASIIGLVKPEIISEKEFFYVALFSSFSLIATLYWIIAWYENVQEFFKKIFNLGIPPHVLVSFYGLIYFVILAFAYESSIFGFFAAVCLSGLFSFSIMYIPGVVTLDFEEKLMPAIIISHTAILGLLTFLNVNNLYSDYVSYFNIGVQYYCTIALALSLLVGSSPFYKPKLGNGLYIFAFIALVAVASFGYFFWDIKVVASILICFFVLMLLEWIGYIGYHINFILGTALVGASLYAVALFLEKYSSMIVLYI